MLDWLLYSVTKLLTIAPDTSAGESASELISTRCLTQCYFDLWDFHEHLWALFFLL